MLRVELMRAKPGMRLALPVQNPRTPGRVLLHANFELTGEILDRLRAHDVRTIFVRYPSLACLERLFPSETLEGQRKLMQCVADTFETLQGASVAKLPYNQYLESIEGLIQSLIRHPQAALFLGDIDTTSDDLLRHSAAVSYLSLLMGLKLEAYLVRERPRVDPVRAKEVRSLGLGAMLHDIGVTALPDEAREQYEATGDAADPQWREHPGLGYQMVRGQIDPSAAAVVLHHHQHFDGTGGAGADYPTLDGHRIHVFARVAAVAAAFDELRHPPNEPVRPTVWALRELLTGPRAACYDPRVLAALLQVVPPYPPGAMVRLSDGRHAVVVDHHTEGPCRPTVQIMPPPDALRPDDEEPGETIDLREAEPGLCVTEAEGQEVTEMNFTPPGFVAEHVCAGAWG